MERKTNLLLNEIDHNKGTAKVKYTKTKILKP